MTETELRLAVGQIVRSVFRRDDLILESTTAARDVKDWDSFKTVEIIIALQEHFAIELDDSDLDELRSFGDLVRIVAGRCSNCAA